jgi:hypothetical protein
VHGQFYCETFAKRKKASPGNAILLNGVTQFANQEIGVPGFLPIRIMRKRENLGGIRLAGTPEKSSGRGQELVAVDARGNAVPAIVRFHTHNFREASNVDIAGHGDFTRQGENEFDGRSRREVRLNQKVEAAETDVPRLTLPFAAARLDGTNR